MSAMHLETGVLRRREVSPAAAVLSDSFADDGIISCHFAAPRRRRLAYPAFFRSVLHRYAGFGTVLAACDDAERIVGVSIWAPPRHGKGPISGSVRATANLGLARLMFPRGLTRLLAGLAELDRARPSEPHWYLEFVGVDAAVRAQQIGSALVTPILDQADADHLACVLDTPFPETFSFYRRLGFEVTAERSPFPGLRPFWTMTRQP